MKMTSIAVVYTDRNMEGPWQRMNAHDRVLEYTVFFRLLRVN